MKFRVFASAVCFIVISQALGYADQDEEGFQRSNYYTNDQGNNVGGIQNQDAAKRQNKKVERFRNTHAKYHEPKRYNPNGDDGREEGPNVVESKSGHSSYKQVEGRTSLEKRSQHRSDSRLDHQSRGHFQIPSDRVLYHDGGIGKNNGRSVQNRDPQRMARKSFNDQNSNWRWGFRRKQAKDHLKDASTYTGGNHNYKSKEATNGRNANFEAMVRNGHHTETGDNEGNPIQNVIQRESKVVGTRTEELRQRPYAPKAETADDQMYRAIGQPIVVQQNAQHWDSKERADGADYQYDNIQKIELQPKATRWMQDGSRNAYRAQKFQPKEIPSPYRNQQPLNRNNAVRADPPVIDNHVPNGPVETKVMNHPTENSKVSNALLSQPPRNQIQPQMGEVRYNYETRNNEQIQNSPNMEDQRLDQTGSSAGYDNGLNVPGNDNEQSDGVQYEAQDAAARIAVATGVNDPNTENRWDDSPKTVNSQRLKHPNAANSKSPGSPSELHQQKARQPQSEEIRYLVLSPAEFNPETLRRTLGEPEKPRGIPCCTLEEYKMESASLKAKSYDAHDRDMHYNGKGSINELISRLKRNYRLTLRGRRRRPIKSRASGEGPEMPVHACTATPSTCEHPVGLVTQAEPIEAATMCWADSLTRPTVSAEDMGINFRITPSYSHDHLRGRLPVMSQFDYTACTSCSTPCEEPRCKGDRHGRLVRNKVKRTPDETLLSDIIRDLQNTTAVPKLPEPKRILPNALEEEKIIEKYLNALMEDQMNQSKTQMKNSSFKVGPGWLENLLKELAQNKLKSKMKNYDKPRVGVNDHSHSKLPTAELE